MFDVFFMFYKQVMGCRSIGDGEGEYEGGRVSELALLLFNILW